MFFRLTQIIIILYVVLLAACARDPLRMEGVEALNKKEIATGTFRVMSLSRITTPQKPVVIYIEGDGRAWINRSTPSSNPTPGTATGLQLALLDTSPNVVYLARPCQFVSNDPACHQDYWTHKRFSPEVIRSMNEAVDHFALPGKGIHLVGYSGGGAVAALVAATRNDVLSLRTLAGNLDTEALNAFHGVSPMPESLNPVDFAPRTRFIPQTHWYGEKDDVVPSFAANNYVQALGAPPCAFALEAKGAAHGEGWLDIWQDSLQKKGSGCVPEIP